MPIFEYECKECGNTSEYLVGVSSENEKIECKKCGSVDVEKIFSAHARINTEKKPASTCAEAGVCPHAEMCGRS